MLQKLGLVVFQSVCAYILLLFLGRIVGRKMLSRITFFDFLIGIIFGSLATHISLGPDTSPLGGITAALVITGLTLLTDHLNLRSPGFRKLEEGEPIVLISGGQILNCNLQKARISLDKLTMLLRQKNIFCLSDVDFAVLENDGQLSVLKKPARQPVAAGDLILPGKPGGMSFDVVMDGEMQYSQLEKRNLDEKWVLDQMTLQNVQDIRDVFYASLEPSGNLYVSIRTKARY